MSEEKHSIRNSVIATVVGSLIVALILWLVPGAWAWVKSAFAWLNHFLTSTATIPMWLLAVMILAILPTVILIIIGIVALSKQPEGPAWTDYTKDQFDGMTWRWQYAGNSMINLWCYCPDDDTALVYSFDEFLDKIAFHCESCKRNFGPFPGSRKYILDKVRRQIDRKVRNGEWKTMVQPAA